MVFTMFYLVSRSYWNYRQQKNKGIVHPFFNAHTHTCTLSLSLLCRSLVTVAYREYYCRIESIHYWDQNRFTVWVPSVEICVYAAVKREPTAHTTANPATIIKTNDPIAELW